MIQVGVIGSSSPTPQQRQIAYQIGKLLARENFMVVCGGLRGVMEAVCKGAKEVEGVTVGILPTDSMDSANPYVDIRIPTGIGEARNAIVAKSGRIIVAIGKGFGTLSELAFALKNGKMVVGIETFDLGTLGIDVKDYYLVSTPEAVVEKVKELLHQRGK